METQSICFTCGKRLNWEKFLQLTFDINYESEEDTRVILDELGYRKLCCRRMFVGFPKEHSERMELYRKYA